MTSVTTSEKFDASPTYDKYGFFEGAYDFDFGLWQPREENSAHPHRKNWMQRNALPMVQGFPDEVDKQLGKIKKPFRHVNDVIQIANQFYSGRPNETEGVPDCYMMMFQRVGRTVNNQYVQHGLNLKIMRDGLALQPIENSPVYNTAVDTWRKVQDRGRKFGNAIIASRIIVTGYEVIPTSLKQKIFGESNEPVLTELVPVEEKLAEAAFHTLVKWPSNPYQ